MISPELAARIRRLRFAEHWKVGTSSSTVKEEPSSCADPWSLTLGSPSDQYPLSPTELTGQHSTMEGAPTSFLGSQRQGLSSRAAVVSRGTPHGEGLRSASATLRHLPGQRSLWLGSRRTSPFLTRTREEVQHVHSSW